MKPEDIKNKKIAVLCDTTEKAKKFCCMCGCIYSDDSIKCRVGSFRSFLCQTYVQKPNVENWVEYASKRHYEEYGYTIITFEQFIEEPLSAEEVIEILLADGKIDAFTERFEEIFGDIFLISEIGGILTPSEIVQKITEWKRKQDKPIRVTEDMIADVLDEKYGIGNWGRE